ncbi:hypothetical protein LTR91_023232 [Friedmanniomyces endolithicus]|uniref:DUF974 domain-containing protein n=1 Tax=Friedmanniomyces endolithicus TaxID=329885 RepID=A0AAN6K1P5_9PEZI|nr:hypothetical protein LTR94_011318 [Friedmanniomyces endolithicus]KAK0773015.1 hypothetical protein LTR38_016717 [Friedmanniomyces endolithicus]KAK0776252.1 hypothetical protein LTR75_016314 [Friedmanniomyces endolithicus]KAK0787356.1 hypothetical protein LTR59_010394 [Friedmanniomyces endolithicus]KAK0836227.1 hypothetical protein LTR03_013854 [Friedmanniomyces endolithicus]
MAPPRPPSTIPSSGGGPPHAITLKVLRLSRPSLATQTPLPPSHFGNGLDIHPQASLAYPTADADSSFPLTPLLTLPSAFGAAYVGETFTCTLCASNGVRERELRSVSAVRIVAELQTPGREEGVVLELRGVEGGAEEWEEGGDVAPGGTLQRTVQYELKEEGEHVLAVTVSYTETLLSSEGGGASGGRARSFRKLYQFVAQQLIAVRSKVTERKRMGRVEGQGRQYVLEAQLENVGEGSAVLERVWLGEREGVTSKAISCGGDGKEAVVLKPRDVEQVMFVLEEKVGSGEVGGRVPLAQLNIDWRGAMGERGGLTTGWLASKGRA